MNVQNCESGSCDDMGILEMMDSMTMDINISWEYRCKCDILKKSCPYNARTEISPGTISHPTWIHTWPFSD